MPSRRQFLASVGLLAAGAAAPSLRPAAAEAGPLDAVVGPASEVVVPLLQQLATDTFAGVAAMVIPGPDPYSAQQGEVHPTPGAVAARAHEFLIGAVDRYLPYPDGLLRPLAHHLATATADAPLPPALAATGEALARTLDEGLADLLLANDQHVPLSTLFTLLLSQLATQVDPATALSGPFAAPFPNLPMASKAEVFRLLEHEHPALVEQLDDRLDEPSRRSLSGLLAFIGNALITFSAFGTFSEFSTWDPGAGGVTGRPVGWDLASFTPGEQVPAEGWDELRGYLGGRRMPRGTRRWPTGPRTLTRTATGTPSPARTEEADRA